MNQQAQIDKLNHLLLQANGKCVFESKKLENCKTEIENQKVMFDL
tara:strand:+ start:511 stop:645 length:135 start_codon:yes stop_codon:yes gene_type:complete